MATASKPTFDRILGKGDLIYSQSYKCMEKWNNTTISCVETWWCNVEDLPDTKSGPIEYDKWPYGTQLGVYCVDGEDVVLKHYVQYT